MPGPIAPDASIACAPWTGIDPPSHGPRPGRQPSAPALLPAKPAGALLARNASPRPTAPAQPTSWRVRQASHPPIAVVPCQPPVVSDDSEHATDRIILNAQWNYHRFLHLFHSTALDLDVLTDLVPAAGPGLPQRPRVARSQTHRPRHRPREDRLASSSASATRHERSACPTDSRTSSGRRS